MRSRLLVFNLVFVVISLYSFLLNIVLSCWNGLEEYAKEKRHRGAVAGARRMYAEKRVQRREKWQSCTKVKFLRLSLFQVYAFVGIAI